MNNPLVSILVPVYNVEPYLRKCLDSILTQTYRNLEIILVDDGSTDTSGAICDAYATQDARIRVIHQENQGLSGARNSGLDVATGEYVQFVDSDDWIDPAMTEKLVDKAEKCGSDVVQCGLCDVVNEQDPKPNQGYNVLRFFPYLDATVDVVEFLTAALSRFVIYSACTKIFRRATVEAFHLRFHDTKEIGYEDSLFDFCLFAVLQRADFMEESLYFYHIRANSLMTTPRLRIAQVVELASRFETFCRQYGVAHKLRRFFPLFAFSSVALELNRARWVNNPAHWTRTLEATRQLHKWPMAKRYFLQAAFGRKLAQYGKIGEYAPVERLKLRLLALALALGGPTKLLTLQPRNKEWLKYVQEHTE